MELNQEITNQETENQDTREETKDTLGQTNVIRNQHEVEDEDTVSDDSYKPPLTTLGCGEIPKQCARLKMFNEGMNSVSVKVRLRNYNLMKWRWKKLSSDEKVDVLTHCLRLDANFP